MHYIGSVDENGLCNGENQSSQSLKFAPLGWPGLSKQKLHGLVIWTVTLHNHTCLSPQKGNYRPLATIGQE